MIKLAVRRIGALCLVTVVSFVAGCTTSAGSEQHGIVTATSRLTSPRAVHTATLLKNGKVLIAGGLLKAEGDEVNSSTAELYDPATGVFTPTASMSAERAGHTATLLQNGDVLITGGGSASAEVYRTDKGVFTPAGRMSASRERHAATALKDGKVLVTGGSSGMPLSSAEIYDPATNSFRQAGNMTTARFAHASTLLPDGKVLLTGGAANWNSVVATAEFFDPAAMKFSLAGTMTASRHKHAATLLPNGKVLIVGGSDSASDWRGRHASAELYDPGVGSFTATGSMKTARFKIPSGLALMPSGELLICGGGEPVEIYSPASGTFNTAYGKVSDSLFYPTATALPDGRVLILGGYDDDLEVSSGAWIYSPPAA